MKKETKASESHDFHIIVHLNIYLGYQGKSCVAPEPINIST